MNGRARLLTSALLLGLVAATPSHATKFQVGALLGLGTPQKPLFNDSQFQEIVQAREFAYLKQESGATFGARGTAWVTPRVGVELEVSRLAANGDLRFAVLGTTQAGDTVAVFDARSLGVNSTTVALMLNYAVVKPALDPVLIWISGGLVAVNRGGKMFETLGTIADGTDIGVGLGVGGSYSLNSTVSVRADLRDYITKYDPEVADAEPFYQAKTQHDLFITAGIDFVIVH